MDRGWMEADNSDYDNVILVNQIVLHRGLIVEIKSY